MTARCEPHFNLAVLYEERGESARAIERYKEALARMKRTNSTPPWPWHYKTLFNLGRLLGREGDAVEQEELWQAAVDANPEFIEGHYLLAEIKLLMDQGGDLKRAEELVRAGLEHDETHQAGALGYFVLADILSRLEWPDRGGDGGGALGPGHSGVAVGMTGCVANVRRRP